MKKIIFALLFICTLISANEQRLVLSGFTIHETKTDNSGYHFNGLNQGIGYEYNTFKKYNQLYYSSNFLVLNDSYKEIQYSIAFSPNIRFRLNSSFSTSIGGSIFLLYKKDNYKLNVNTSTAKYDFIAGAAPVSSLFFKNLSISVAYVPTFSLGDISTTGFAYFYLTLVFN